MARIENRVNKNRIWILNCQLETYFNIEGFLFGFHSFRPNVGTNFAKNHCDGWGKKNLMKRIAASERL